MVGMARHAIWLDERLMESNGIAPFGHRHALCRADANIGKLVTSDTTIRRYALEWRVAGKTIAGDVCMAGDQWSRCNHQMRQQKCENNQPAQIERDQPKTPTTLHFQPQNRKTAMIWANASTANAKVIGR